MFKRITSASKRLAVISVISLSAAVPVGLGSALTAASPAGATDTSSCNAWITSTAILGGGVSAFCPGIRNWVRSTGWCRNVINGTGNWVYGPWKRDAPSFAPCQRYQVPTWAGYQVGGL